MGREPKRSKKRRRVVLRVDRDQQLVIRMKQRGVVSLKVPEGAEVLKEGRT